MFSLPGAGHGKSQPSHIKILTLLEKIMFSKFKEIAEKGKVIAQKGKAIVLGATGAVVATAGNAIAALSVDQQAVVTGIETLYTDMTTVAWGFVLTVTTLFLGIKIFKKVMSRST